MGDVAVVKSVACSRQLRFAEDVEHFPPKSIVRHYWGQWCKDPGQQGGEEVATEGADVKRPRHPFLRHPGKRREYADDGTLKRPTNKSKYDPIQLLSAASFQHLLRDEEKFGTTLERAQVRAGSI